MKKGLIDREKGTLNIVPITVVQWIYSAFHDSIS